MNKLYHRHISKLETVNEKIKRFKETGDDMYLDDACFELQQCTEFMLKGLLTDLGVPFPDSGSAGHDIRSLMDIVNNNVNIENSKWERLYNLSSTITYWETHGRYGESIKVKINVVEEIRNTVRELNTIFIEIMDNRKDIQK